MTPQEKAIELVDKFKYISYYLDDIQNHKEGALIAVDEIINSVDNEHVSDIYNVQLVSKQIHLCYADELLWKELFVFLNFNHFLQ